MTRFGWLRQVISGLILTVGLSTVLMGIWYFLREYYGPTACLERGGAYDYAQSTCAAADAEVDVGMTTYGLWLAGAFGVLLACSIAGWMIIRHRQRIIGTFCGK